METEKKHFKRSEDRMLAGVCAGIAEYFRIDVKITRIVYFGFTILTIFFSGYNPLSGTHAADAQGRKFSYTLNFR